MDRRIERGAATRDRFVETAIELFTTHGYAGVSIEAVLQACGVSRGALYHHFPGKDALFTAALEVVEQRIAAAVMAAALPVVDPMARVKAGTRAWLSLASEDETVRRMVLGDAPAVLGWSAWRALEERYVLGLLKTGLTAVAETGEVAPDRVTFYANALLALLTEAALMIAQSPDPAAATGVAQETIDAFLGGLSRR